MTRSRSAGFRSSNITARIPLQSWKSLLAISMTASPREKRFRAPRRMAGRENPPMPAAGKTTGPAIVYLCHCEERSDVAIRSFSVPQRGTGGEKHRRDADCHVGLCPPRNDVVVWAGPSDWGGGCRCVGGRFLNRPYGTGYKRAPVEAGAQMLLGINCRCDRGT